MISRIVVFLSFLSLSAFASDPYERKPYQFGDVDVSGYTRADGTVVQPYKRSLPKDDLINQDTSGNWSNVQALQRKWQQEDRYSIRAPIRSGSSNIYLDPQCERDIQDLERDLDRQDRINAMNAESQRRKKEYRKALQADYEAQQLSEVSQKNHENDPVEKPVEQTTKGSYQSWVDAQQLAPYNPTPASYRSERFDFGDQNAVAKKLFEQGVSMKDLKFYYDKGIELDRIEPPTVK